MWIWMVFHLMNARAHSIEDIYVRHLIRARSNYELRQYSDTFDELKVARLKCRLQIKRGLVPVGCYDHMNRGKDWGEVDAADPTLSQLDRQCRAAARAFRLPHAKANLKNLSPTCRTLVDRARQIVAYQQESSPGWSED